MFDMLKNSYVWKFFIRWIPPEQGVFPLWPWISDPSLQKFTIMQTRIWRSPQHWRINAPGVRGLSDIVDHRTMVSSRQPSDKMRCQVLLGSFSGDMTRSRFSRTFINPSALSSPYPISGEKEASSQKECLGARLLVTRIRTLFETFAARCLPDEPNFEGLGPSHDSATQR